MRKSLPFGLQRKEAADFDLRPNKVGVLRPIRKSIPRSPAHDALYEVGVVARPYKKFDLALVLLNQLDHDTIGIGHLPHEIPVVVELEGGFELQLSFGKEALSFDREVLLELGTLVALQIRLLCGLFVCSQSKQVAEMLVTLQFGALQPQRVAHLLNRDLLNREVVFDVVAQFGFEHGLQHLLLVPAFAEDLHLLRRGHFTDWQLSLTHGIYRVDLKFTLDR